MKRLPSLCVLVIVVVMAGASTASAQQTGAVTGKVRGVFHRDCFACGDSAKYIVATNAWCGWRDGNVVIHVRFRNRSVETLKVTWHPSYTIRNGSDHGTGLTSLQDTKLRGGQAKDVIVSQSPKGTPARSAISVCKPSFYLVDH
jgi:hypothetical protein